MILAASSRVYLVMIMVIIIVVVIRNRIYDIILLLIRK